jgi:hypothetical protein
VQIPCPETTPFFFCLGVHVASLPTPTEGAAQGEASLASAERDAMASAFAAFESPAPSSAPTESTQPAAPPSVPGQPAPPAAPVSAAPAPAAPTTIDLSTLTPEARAFLERKGFDANKAFADALRNDSRLAALARGEADPLGQVRLGAQPPQPTQPEPPAAPAAVDPAAIEQRVVQFYQSDPTCVQAIQSFTANQTRLDKIETELAATNQTLQRAQLLATLDEIKADPLRLQDVQRDLDKHEAVRLRLEQEKDLLTSRNEREDARFRNAVAAKRAEILGEHQQQVQEQQERAAYEAEVETAASALEAGFPSAVAKAMETYKIPADERQDFEEEVANAMYAHLDKGLGSIADLNAYVDKRAEAYAARIERAHRLKSAEYARLAHERTALGGTQNGVVVATKPTETEAPKDLQSLYKQTERDLLATFQGQRQ